MTNPERQDEPVELNSALDLADRYDVFCLDVQGVLMNGHRAGPGAADLVQELRRRGKSLCILTNRFSASPAEIGEELIEAGLPVRGCPVITPREALVKWVRQENMGQQACVVLGSDADRDFAASAGLSIVGWEDAFSVLLVGHPEVSLQRAELERAVSRAALATESGRRTILLVANPDCVIPGDDGVQLGPGAAAEILVNAMARIVGPDALDVQFLGKPAPWLFRLAREKFPVGRMILIGDQLETDIEGACRAGMDSALLVSAELMKRRSTHAEGTARPTYTIQRLI